MNSATRGAVLAIIAVALGFAILNWGADLQPNPVFDPGIFRTPEPTAEADDSELSDVESESAPVVDPTAVVDVTQARPNSQVAVLVANGTDVAGQAARLTDRLRNQGFNTREPRSASLQTSSVIYYRAGFEAEAAVIVAALNTTTPTAPMPPTLSIGADVDLGPVDVLVLIGADPLSTG